jgi:GAF domain-containing protein
LVLGPFQGPVACTRIKKGNGVCGKAWAEKRPVVVDNVNLFPGHIACSSKSKSEIVIPLIKECEVVGVLDIDSEQLAAFNNEDLLYLNEICEWFVNTL